MIFIATLCGLALGALFLFHYDTKTMLIAKNVQFEKLQNTYLTVYYLATFSDWLQGPYVYKVYSDYGYAEEDIAYLYIAGFASSSFFGAVIGHLADKYGRKLVCTSFGLIYSTCCLSKLSSNFYVLLIGRIMGGVSTSILFSTFEAWYINEHIHHLKLPQEWLNITFSKASFFTGFLAIVAGIVSQISVETLDLTSVSPFVIAVPFLLLCSFLIVKTWEEHPYTRTCSHQSFIAPVYLIVCKERILLVMALIQSMFEAVMYSFIFSWTPIISELNPPLGIVFASFMLSFMIGSKTYSICLSKRFVSEFILIIISGLAFLCFAKVCYVMSCFIRFTDMSIEARTALVQVCFVCFVVYEMILGVYFPVIGYLKSKIVPEEHRASISNWFRAPMNIFTCISLTLNRIKKNSNDKLPLSFIGKFQKFHFIYTLCSVFLLLTLIASIEFRRRYTKRYIADQFQGKPQGINDNGIGPSTS